MIVIAAYRGKSLLSRYIRWETNSAISHVSIMQLPDNVWSLADGVRVNVLYRAMETCPVYEAWRDGVVCRRGIHEGHTPDTPIELLRIDSTVRIPEAELIRDLDRIVAAGTRYDWIGLLRYKLRINRDNPNRMFCSELVHHVLSTRGIFLIRRAEPHKVSPGDLYRSALLRELWKTSTEKRAGRPLNASQGNDAPTPVFGGRGPMHNNAQALPALFGPSSAETVGMEGLKQVVRQFNAALHPMPNAAEGAAADELIPLVNASVEADADGWLSVPYADVPIGAGEVRGIQRLTPSSAAQLVNSFNSWRGRLSRMFRGLPFYIGHPDSKVFGQKHTDGRAYGWIKELKAGADALLVRVDWTNAGAELVNDKAFHWWSPFFLGRIVGKENGVTIYEPAVLQSAGFTNEPNWPGAALPNEKGDGSDAGGEVPTVGDDENRQNEEVKVTLLERIKALLGMDGINNDDDAVGAISTLVAGVRKIKESIDARWAAEDAARQALPNNAGELDVIGGYLEHVGGHMTELAAAAQAAAATGAELVNATATVTTLQTELVNAAATVTTLGTELATERVRVNTLETQLQAERGARAAELVNTAVADGRVLPANAEARKAALLAAPDFESAVAELVNARPVIKVVAKTRDLGERSTDQRTRQEKIIELVNSRMAETKEDYDTAFGVIRRSPDHAALFINEPAD